MADLTKNYTMDDLIVHGEPLSKGEDERQQQEVERLTNEYNERFEEYSKDTMRYLARSYAAASSSYLTF